MPIYFSSLEGLC